MSSAPPPSATGGPRASRPPEHIHSRANPLLAQLRRLAQDGAAYRRLGLLWLEGEHLCSAALARGWPLQRVLIAERAAGANGLLERVPPGVATATVADALFAELSTLESPSPMGCVVPLPAAPALQPDVPTVVLDRLQDPGNAGSILRSAAALGVRQVVALKGTVALWSPKVLRAGMGAHFALALIEGAGPEALEQLTVPLVTTSSHAGTLLPEAALPPACAWVLGHEGQGVDAALQALSVLQVRIPQPGGEESLNVAAAAAICFYEAARRRSGGVGANGNPGAQ